MRSFRVVIEPIAWSTPFNFLAISPRQTQLLILESAGSLFQFAFSLLLIDITRGDRYAE